MRRRTCCFLVVIAFFSAATNEKLQRKEKRSYQVQSIAEWNDNKVSYNLLINLKESLIALYRIHVAVPNSTFANY